MTLKNLGDNTPIPPPQVINMGGMKIETLFSFLFKKIND